MNWKGLFIGLGLGVVLSLGAVVLLYKDNGKSTVGKRPQSQPAIEVTDIAPQSPPSIETQETQPSEQSAVEGTVESVAVVSETTVDPIPEAPMKVDGSDSFVVAAIGQLSPSLVRWFTPDEQLRKWVLAVDLLADGKLPQRHRPIQYPMAKYGVEKRGDYYYSVSGNVSRTQPLVEAVVALDPKTVGRIYREWLPVLERAYDELGKAGSFKNRVGLMIARVLEVGPAPTGAKLHRPHVFYEFVDENLENASDLDKWVWRLGDSNREALQAWVKEVRFYL